VEHHTGEHRAVEHRAEEHRMGPSGPGAVVLDIGPHAGALVLYTDEDLAGAEIEIRPGGGAWTGTHTEVRARHVGGPARYAGVFGSLAPGPYDLRLKDGGPRSFDLSVEVDAGSVAQVTLGAAAPASHAPLR
jgi:hypothetical protein